MLVTPLAVLMQEMPEAGDLLDAIPALTLLGFAIACIRLAVGQADKRATVAEAREKTCIEALATTSAAITLVTTEVKANRDGLSTRLEPIERGIAELLDHARRAR